MAKGHNGTSIESAYLTKYWNLNDWTCKLVCFVLQRKNAASQHGGTALNWRLLTRNTSWKWELPWNSLSVLFVIASAYANPTLVWELLRTMLSYVRWGSSRWCLGWFWGISFASKIVWSKMAFWWQLTL